MSNFLILAADQAQQPPQCAPTTSRDQLGIGPIKLTQETVRWQLVGLNLGFYLLVRAHCYDLRRVFAHRVGLCAPSHAQSSNSH